MEFREESAVLFAFETTLLSEEFAAWLTQYCNEDQIPPIMEYLKLRGVTDFVILRDIEVAIPDQGKGLGKILLKRFLDQSSKPIVLVADSFGSNLMNLESWYTRNKFETFGKTVAGPIMLYML